MALWGFQCYIDDEGTDVVRAWNDGLSKEGKAAFLGKLMNLRALPREQWRRPLYANLEHDGDGIGEIRFKAGGLQYRPLGFHLSAIQRFVLVVPATKKADQWTPSNAIALAQRRKAEVVVDGGRALELDWLKLE
jgi:phage-related protein